MDKPLHEGHRSRMRSAAQNDPDLVSFSEYEVLEYLLSFLIPRKDTNPIAHELIDRFGSLYGVLHANIDELYEVPYMTKNASALLASLYAIFRRSEISRTKETRRITNVAEAVEVLKPYFVGRNEERIYCIALDLNDKILQVALVGEGMANFTLIDNNKIFAIASRNKAKKIILAHNHPGGSLEPSPQDINATRQLFLILDNINAVLNDHIIFTNDGYFSFYDRGIMDESVLASDRMFGTNTYSELRVKRLSGTYALEPRKPE